LNIIKFKLFIFISFLLSFNILLSQSNNLPKIKLGVDNLIESNFEIIKGKRIALLTNNAGRTNTGKLTVKAFLEQDECKLVEILTPEHGFYTTIPAGDAVNDATIFGVPSYSLYGTNRRPGKSIINNVEVVVVDLQDIGVRSYTYLSTLYNTIDACAEFGKPVIILDRPNPLSGYIVDGNIVDKGMESFVSIIPVPYVHGCTFGELSNLINDKGWLSKDTLGNPRKCDITVIKMTGWQPWMTWEDTGLPWIPTSPNIPSVDAIRGAAMLGWLGELGIFNIGIGTNLPFQYIGSTNFKTEEIIKEIGSEQFDGIKFIETIYRPLNVTNSKEYTGFLIKFSKSKQFLPYSSGIKLILALRKIYPEFFSQKSLKENSTVMFKKVTGTKSLFDAIIDGTDDDIKMIARYGVDSFLNLRMKYLLY
jgi:uncharacterized protein YbbC (DUF1343 family)